MKYVSVIMISSGFFLFLAATIGFLRLPDFYTRMHATGKGDTLGLLLIIMGLFFYELSINWTWSGVITGLKLIAMALFWFLASPTATHTLLRAAFETGIRPWSKDKEFLIDKTQGESNDIGR
ncbi:MAG: monovalent cation/H(+) antiporter subunit G [Syntrophales bacterium]|nr:monovalent cation/H(+) antiporter subunit G [Syntrophales bacterium]